MGELQHIIFSLVNGPLSVILVGLLIYWVFTTFGVFDPDSFDIDVDFDADIDIDIDADIGTDVIVDDFSGAKGEEVLKNKKKKLSPFEVFLVYFHFVEIPFMMALTVFIFVWWLITLVTTDILGLYNNFFGFVILFASFIPALFIMKFITYPLKSIMKKMNPKGVENLEVIGHVGQTITKVTSEKLGQIQLVLDESPIKVYAKCINQNQIIEENTEILVIKKSVDSKYYLIDLNN